MRSNRSNRQLLKHLPPAPLPGEERRALLPGNSKTVTNILPLRKPDDFLLQDGHITAGEKQGGIAGDLGKGPRIAPQQRSRLLSPFPPPY